MNMFAALLSLAFVALSSGLPQGYAPAPVYAPAPLYAPAPAYAPAPIQDYDNTPVVLCENYPYCDDAPYNLGHLQVINNNIIQVPFTFLSHSILYSLRTYTHVVYFDQL